MFKFLLPKQFFINEKKNHNNFNKDQKGIRSFERFDNGNIIINYCNDKTLILDKKFEILYEENIGEIDYFTTINNDQFIGIGKKGIFLFSFIYSNYIDLDNPSEPLNQKKIIKIVSENFFKPNTNDVANIFYDKNNNKIYYLECNIINSNNENLNNEKYNYNIYVFDFFKNKITLKKKIEIQDNDLCILKFMIFRNKYFLLSKKQSLRVFNANDMKEIFPEINNLKLNDGNYIIDLMNLNNEFLLIKTNKKLIKYDLDKREILSTCVFSLDFKRWTTTKNYLFLYESQTGVIIYDKKAIRPIQSKHITNILFIDEISDEKIKFTTACDYIFCDKSQKNKIYLFSCLRFFTFIFLLLLFIREIRIILSREFKILIYEAFKYLFKSSNINAISFKNINNYIRSNTNYFDNNKLFIFNFFIFLVKLIMSICKFNFMGFKFFFFSNHLIFIIIRCIFFIVYILILSLYYHDSFPPECTFISDYY